MAKKTKNKSGKGKFFLGALLGGVAGAIAGRFIKNNMDSGEEIDESDTAPVETVGRKSTKTTKKAK